MPVESIFSSVINAMVKGSDEVIKKEYVPNSHKFYNEANGDCLCEALSIDEDLMTLDFRVCVREFFQSNSNANTIDLAESSGTVLNNQFLFQYSERGFVVDALNNKVILNSAPSFLVEDGDVLVVGQKAKLIQTVLTQTELIFSTVEDISDGVGIVSQKMQTIDLTQLEEVIGLDTVKIADAIQRPILESLVYIHDDTFESEINAGVDFFRIAFQVSGDDNTYTDAGEIPVDFKQRIPHKNPSLSDGSFKIQFFAKNVSGDGVAKLNGWRAYFHKLTPEEEEEV